MRGTCGPLIALILWLCAGPALAQRSSPVGYTEIANREVQRTLQLTGSVESRRSSVIAAEVEGLVRSMDVDEGEHVSRDKALVRIRSTNLELSLQAAEGRLKEARARLDLAGSKRDRADRLFEHEIISQDELDDAHSELTAWQGRMDATAAEIARLQVDLQRCVIRAPFDGAVVRKRTEVGQWVAVGGPVLELVALRDLDVRIEVPEKYFGELKPGTRTDVRIEALPGQVVNGRILSIIPSADPQARTFPVKLRIPNDNGRLAAGMLAQVFLPVGDLHDALIVPKDAVIRQGSAELVYRIRDDDTVEPVQVTSGQGLGQWIVIEGPIERGQRIVTRGNERLRQDQQVVGTLQGYPLP